MFVIIVRLVQRWKVLSSKNLRALLKSLPMDFVRSSADVSAIGPSFAVGSIRTSDDVRSIRASDDVGFIGASGENISKSAGSCISIFWPNGGCSSISWVDISWSFLISVMVDNQTVFLKLSCKILTFLFFADPPSIFPTACPWGTQGPGAYSICHWARGGLHPGQLPVHRRAKIYREISFLSKTNITIMSEKQPRLLWCKAAVNKAQTSQTQLYRKLCVFSNSSACL